MDCICKEYLAGIFPALGKCARGALETLFGGIVAEKSTLVTDLARPLRRDSSATEAKRANERVSGWLGRWDFVSAVNPWLLEKAREAVSDEATYALDFSDISKEFGGRGMEGMAMGRDGSRGGLAMGHDFVCVSLVGGGRREARTVYARLAKGRKSKGTLHAEALSAVMGATGSRGWTAEDRGMDAAEHIAAVKREGWKVVVRIKDMDRDVFGDGLAIDQSLAREPFVPATLRKHEGSREVQLRWRASVRSSGWRKSASSTAGRENSIRRIRYNCCWRSDQQRPESPWAGVCAGTAGRSVPSARQNPSGTLRGEESAPPGRLKTVFKEKSGPVPEGALKKYQQS